MGASADEPRFSEVWEHVQRLHREAREKSKLDVWLGLLVDKVLLEAGVKTDLVEQGFLEFVKSSKSGHLFITVGHDGDPLRPLQGLVNRLAEFARQVINDPNVQPNHGWRHRFKTAARDVAMYAGVRDAIQGHASWSVAESYGSVSMRAKVAAIGKLPRYEI